MAEIIDNVLVGEKIKSLLKQHKMTQEDLALKLSISKSAVSQNLRGKSTFDIQNLIKIAEIFNISLDELLNLNYGKEQDWISEYQKIVQKGLKAIIDVPVENLTITNPDVYGRVLIDYVIESNNLKMFKYLHEHDVVMTDLFYHRAKEILLNILIYGLQNKVHQMYKYIELYTQINGSFHIEDEVTSKLIWGLIDQVEDVTIIENISKYKSDYKGLFQFKKQVNRPLSKESLITIIAKYKLGNVLKIWLEHGANLDDLTKFIELSLDHDFDLGIKAFIAHFVIKPLSWIKKVSLDVQRLYLKVVEKNNLELIKLFAEMKLYIDLSAVIKRMIKLDQLTNAIVLITHYPDQLNFKEVGFTALNHGHLNLVDNFLHLLEQDDLNYLLASIKLDKVEALMYLLKHGAKLEEKYYNYETFTKVNVLIQKLIDKGETS